MKKLVKVNHIKLQNSRHVQELLQIHENSLNPTLSLIYMLHWGIITTEENLILPFIVVEETVLQNRSLGNGFLIEIPNPNPIAEWQVFVTDEQTKPKKVP